MSVQAQVHVGRAGDLREEMERELSLSTSAPHCEDEVRLEPMFGTEDLQDPFLCPKFDLGVLNETNELLEHETMAASKKMLSNVAVLVSSGMVEELSGSTTGWGEVTPGGGATLTSRADSSHHRTCSTGTDKKTNTTPKCHPKNPDVVI